MRLIDTATLEFKEFIGDNVPPYAILSHTWEDEEITFQDMNAKSEAIKRKGGYRKIIETCRLAQKENLKYAWVDTCSIDKTSSAELSEAINSMFQWYRNSAVCYVYLSDLPIGEPTEKVLPSCRWFTRGWTLQELIAPQNLLFFDSDWNQRGDKRSGYEMLSQITGIDKELLISPPNLEAYLNSISVATKMSWASQRKTTRTEDIAYCLLGIFNIQMPLLYGEGQNAFRRLQEEISKKAPDLSILAWRPKAELPRYPQNQGFTGILAPSVDCFEGVNFVWSSQGALTVTNMGLQVSSSLIKSVPKSPASNKYSFVILLGVGSASMESSGLIYLSLVRLSPIMFVREESLIFGHRGDIGSSIGAAEVFLDFNPTEELIENALRYPHQMVEFHLANNLRMIHAIPRLNWELSPLATYADGMSVLIISVIDKESFQLALFNPNWRLFESVYIINQSEPVMQYIIHDPETQTVIDLMDRFEFAPAGPVYQRSNGSSELVHKVPVKGGHLVVKLLTEPGASITRSRPVFISCTFEQNQPDIISQDNSRD